MTTKIHTTSRIIKAFEKEVNLTDEGLTTLTEQKKGLLIDIKTKEGMTLARKERTERNKLIDQVKRVAIDTKTAIDARRCSITDQITDIFAPIVNPFEIEDLRLKEEKKRLAVIEEDRVKKIKDEINEIRGFAYNLAGNSSQELSDIIEAVDMIDVNEVFAEFTQEALQVKKETLTELNLYLSSVMQKEALAEEHAELDAQKLKLKAQERLNTLMMIPTTMFGKTSKEIEEMISKVELNQIIESQFGELFDQANQSVKTVIKQLGTMLAQTKFMEEQQPKTEVDKVIDSDRQQVIIKKVNPVQIVSSAPLTWHQKMIKQVDFWAKEYRIINSEYSDLMNILNQYK